MKTEEYIDKIKYKLSNIDFIKLCKTPNELGNNICMDFKETDFHVFFSETQQSEIIVSNFITSIIDNIINEMKSTKNYGFVDLRNSKNSDLLINEICNHNSQNILIPQRFTSFLNIYTDNRYYGNNLRFVTTSYNKNIYSSTQRDSYYNNVIYLFNDIYIDIKKIETMNNGKGLTLRLNYDYMITNDIIYVFDDECTDGLELYRDYKLDKIL